MEMTVPHIILGYLLLGLVYTQTQNETALPSANNQEQQVQQRQLSSTTPEENDPNGPVVIYSKRCTTSTECNWGFECKRFERVLTAGAAPSDVFNCVECRPSCRSDAECKQPTPTASNNDGASSNNIAPSPTANPADRLKCFHGCCKPKSLEKEFIRTPILRGAPDGNHRRVPMNLNINNH